MATTKRQTILGKLDTLLKTILTTNGYETNAGQHVFEWLGRPLEQGEMPGIVWQDMDDVVEQAVQADNHRLRVVLWIAASSATAPADIRKIIGDIVTALNTELVAGDGVFDGYADNIYREAESMVTEHKENFQAVARLPIVIEYETQHMNPYS
jgi:hypothetical protein